MSTTDSDAPSGQWSDRLSTAWERHRERLFESQRNVSEWLVDQLDPQPGQTILELAAGPGETGFLVAERIGPSGRLVSTDMGPGMVDAARRGGEARGLTNVEYREMDAQEMDLDDASVDGVLCRFGFMLMPEPGRALTEVRRVLRPGGRLAYAVWGPGDRNPWMTAMGMALVQNGHVPPGNPTDPGGPFSLGSPEANRELLAAAGFAQVDVEELPGFMRSDDVDDYWAFNSEVSGPIALLLASLPADARERVRASIGPIVEPYRTERGLEIPSLAVGVRAS